MMEQEPMPAGTSPIPGLDRILLESTLDAVVTMDAVGRIRDWNGRAEALFGWSAAEAAGRKLGDLIIPPRYREAHVKGLSRFLSTGRGPFIGHRLELAALRRDGDEFPVELTISANRAGDEWIFIGFLRDQTVEKKIQGRLQVQNALFSLLAESPDPAAIEPILLDAVCGMDPWLFGACWRPDGEVLRCTTAKTRKGRDFPALLEATRSSAFRRGEGLPGRVWEQRRPVWVSDIRKEEVPRRDALEAEGLGTAFAVPVVVRREVSLILEFFGRSSREPDGELIAFAASLAGQLGLFLERKAAEEEREELFDRLEEERKRLSAVLDLGPTPMLLLEPGTARVLFTNKAAHALAGGRLKAGSLPTEWPSTDSRGRRLALEELPGVRAARGETVTNAELDWHVDGKRLSLLVSSSTLRGQDGKPELVVLVLQDLTPMKQVEEQLRQSQKMEAIGQLAGGIAHDFNNLLTAINGYSSMALERLPVEDPLHGFMSEVLRSGERAAGLTRQLLAYSRKQVLESRLWDLNVIVSGMQGMLRRLIPEDITLATDLAPSATMAKVDRGQVEQILLNLALNSRDAMPGGGRLSLETRILAAEEVPPEASTAPGDAPIAGPLVMLAVADTGTGMTPEVQARAFEPFFTTKEVGKGTGLGLSSVYGIVKQSGGSIAVRSEPGKGTAVRIYFPAAAGTAEGPDVRTSPARDHRGGESLLLVEDEEAVRRFAAQALEAQGYTVRAAADGREALGILAGGAEPALVITDVVMPETGGRVLAERIRAMRPGLPILFISGYTEGTLIHPGPEDPLSSFLQKPFGPGDLGRAVREALDRSVATQRATEK